MIYLSLFPQVVQNVYDLLTSLAQIGQVSTNLYAFTSCDGVMSSYLYGIGKRVYTGGSSWLRG